MEIEQGIKNILFQIGKEIKIHRIDEDNTILDIDYDKYTIEIMSLFKKYLENS